MPSSEHLNSFQFYAYPMKNGNSAAETGAINPKTNELAAHLEWNEDEVQGIWVEPKYRRLGLATELWKRANTAHEEAPWHFPKPEHSKELSSLGRIWVNSLKKGK